MKPLARFTEATDPKDTRDDLLLGALLRQTDLLKSGRIYQIEECEGLGELVIRDMGESAIESKPNTIQVGWCHTINWIIETGLAYALLTKKEVETL